MKILSRICALALAALGACQAPATTETVEAAPAAPVEHALVPADDGGNSGPAMWKVSDQDTTIYILGTVHILPEGIEWFDGRIEQAFDSSELLVTEITDGDPLTMQALVMDKAMLSGKQTLRGLLDERERSEYEAALNGLGIPLNTFDRFEPWYASVGLSTLPLMREGFSGDNGVDKFLQSRAAQKGLAQEGLETAELQLSMFDTLPLQAQKNYLAEIVAELPSIGAQLKAMIEAWKTGKADELANLMNASQSDPLLIDRLLTSRNKAWARWVDARLDQPGTVFLAVGAGHLAGEGSLQDQLAAQGITSVRLQ